jgi:anti-sigma factor RsiW
MPTCKECIDILQDYLEGVLPAEMAHELDEHFGACPPCVQFVATYRAVPKLSRHALAASEIPSEVASRLKDALRRARGAA